MPIAVFTNVYSEVSTLKAVVVPKSNTAQFYDFIIRPIGLDFFRHTFASRYLYPFQHYVS